uniref:Uncharacterized protein n=1 Tax=viral metagenome TaxID=1070528 RepID=A0A6M3KHD9_9ZZZZ
MPNVNVSIKIKQQTLATLKELAHPGQSIDGIINEIITIYQNIDDYWKHLQSRADK